MDLSNALQDSSAGMVVTDADFNVIWANKFEEEFYEKPIIGLWIVDCHKESNREKIIEFIEKFKTGELKSFTKVAVGMLITYSSYFKDGQFAGIVRTRIRMIS